jgi:hypothetical protein
LEEGKNPTHDNKAPVSRERLYEEVWAEPMTKVVLKYNVSSSFMARVCTWLNVPRKSANFGRPNSTSPNIGGIGGCNFK